MAPRFDPHGAIARADAALSAIRQIGPGSPNLDSALAELEAARAELDLTIEFYRQITPGWSEFTFKFLAGAGGVIGMPVTFGWSMAVTLASLGLALNDVRNFVDNRAQIDRINTRILLINAALGRYP